MTSRSGERVDTSDLHVQCACASSARLRSFFSSLSTAAAYVRACCPYFFLFPSGPRSTRTA
ncbi:MAG: hypothetical protein EOO41_01540 [Methanobacteriota archaeon]|nr:MAG: hypothetical protein EOO41_01540 [Euryarchaeota archaeon]